MPLTRPVFVDKAFPNASDLRKAQSAIFPREGVFPDPTTILAAGIAYAGSGWAVGARPFTANLKRGGAPFSQTYGSAQVANDGAVAAAWTLPGAPSSGTVVSLLWVRAADPTQGESTTQVAGETGPTGALRPRALPEFGVTTGTTAVAPVLPAGAELIARASVASTSTSAATSTIVQAYDFANVLGGAVYVRDLAHRAAVMGSPMRGETVFRIDKGWLEEWNGAGWEVIGRHPERNGRIFLNSGGNVGGGNTLGTFSVPSSPQAQRVYVDLVGHVSPSAQGDAGLSVSTSAGTVTQNPQVRIFTTVGAQFYAYGRRLHVDIPANSPAATISVTTEGSVTANYQVTADFEIASAGQY